MKYLQTRKTERTATKVLLQQPKAERSDDKSQITRRTQQYWCVHRPASKEVRHLEEKSSRGFRFLRHRHKTRTLRHQWTQVTNNCDKHAVISVPIVTYLRNIWWITTNDEASETNVWLHQHRVTPETQIWQPSTPQKVWRHLSGKTAN